MNIRSDTPIRKQVDDLLERKYVAKLLASQFVANAKSESYVLAVLGPWGSGKTSVINMIEEELSTSERVIPLRFDPWLFSGTDQLFQAFFDRMAAQLQISKHDSVKRVANGLEKYGAVLAKAGAIPHVGLPLMVLGLLGMGAGVGAKRLSSKELREFDEQRDALVKQLTELDYAIVVIIDDVDRLHSSEIVSLMRLIRVLARFPNIHYLLSMDRRRVEEALDEGVLGRGRAYLEKIVQSTYDLPEVDRERLSGI